MAYSKKLSHLPPNCGADLEEPLLFNAYQQSFQQARRMRYCLNCHRVDAKTGASGLTGPDGRFACPFCQKVHVSNLTAPRLYDRLLVLAGRGGGKTKIGAHAAREEIMVPNSIGWVMGATHKILHDSTFPTLVRLLPPDWIKKWDSENMEITFNNGAVVAFRSLQDNPDRARGPHGVGWGWFDEAAQCPERAYDVFEPTLIKAGGIVIATTTVLGYDWTWDKIEKHALAKEPGFYAVRYWTEENPLFASNPVMKAKIDRAKLTMTSEFYAQEYKAERRNAEGLVYDFSRIEQQTITELAEIRKLIPEFPNVNPDRPVLIGLDSGVDHPFGAACIIVTEKGLVVIDEYLQRQKALSSHIGPIRNEFLPPMRFQQGQPVKVTWAANKNEANLRLEFALKGIGVVAAEAKHEIGIQRVQSWLLTGQLFFWKPGCPLTVEQMQSYRYMDNIATDGQKKAREEVFKKKDELPDAVRYAIMAWPSLPEAKHPEMTEKQLLRWDQLDERTRMEIERVRDYNKASAQEASELEEGHPGFPLGDFFGATGTW